MKNSENSLCLEEVREDEIKPNEMSHIEIWLVWFLCLMSYQLFLGYLMPKPVS